MYMKVEAMSDDLMNYTLLESLIVTAWANIIIVLATTSSLKTNIQEIQKTC
jgi:hypothetical protein